MHDNQSLDEMRRQIQESLINTTREQLQEEFGPFYEGGNTQLPPELHNEWLNHILEFERQFEQARCRFSMCPLFSESLSIWSKEIKHIGGRSDLLARLG